MKRLLLISMIALICSCSTDRDWEHTEPELVVEGWIEAGRAPVVMVTTSVSPSREFRTVGQLQDHIVKWGKVSISSPDTTVILFGRTDKDYYPPYIFTTGWIIGKAGETYTLNVEYEGMHASATTTVTAPEPLEGLSAVKVEGSDSLFTLVARLNNRSSDKKYYQIFTKVEGKDSFFVPAFPGAIDGSGIADNACGGAVTELPLEIYREVAYGLHSVDFAFLPLCGDGWHYVYVVVCRLHKHLGHT